MQHCKIHSQLIFIETHAEPSFQTTVLKKQRTTGVRSHVASNKGSKLHRASQLKNLVVVIVHLYKNIKSHMLPTFIPILQTTVFITQY
jgi:hypothetical protein